MEEDIKILKDTLEKYCYKNCKGEIDDSCKECKRLQALENLIKEYRIKELQLHLLREETIPKSKIKEKIEELRNKLKYIACGNDDCDKCFNSYRGSEFIYCFAYHQIKVLQQLMEDK